MYFVISLHLFIFEKIFSKAFNFWENKQSSEREEKKSQKIYTKQKQNLIKELNIEYALEKSESRWENNLKISKNLTFGLRDGKEIYRKYWCCN